MYCENCGCKLNEQDLFCEDCGTKINRVNVENNKSSNKTLWIVLGSVFGGLFLLIVLGILFFTFFIIDLNENVETYEDYELNDYYDYDYDDMNSYDEV